MPLQSAGLLPYRRSPRGSVEVLLAHMGGPFWAKRDAGAWTIVKGEIAGTEEPMAAVRREFAEELGIPAPEGPYLDLGTVRQRAGKIVAAWAVEADVDPAEIVPGTFEMEWPPRSGHRAAFPEVDRVAWFGVEEGREVIIAAQRTFLDRLLALLSQE